MALVKCTSIKFVDMKKLRNKSGLTLKQLEEKSGVDFRNLSHYENESFTMNEATWERIKQALRK
jgi:transcriptional regulator with XRE-family HTH domain